MPQPTGDFPGVRGAVLAVGAWLHPATAYRRRSEPELRLQFRAGLIGLICIVTGLGALGIGLWWYLIGPELGALDTPAVQPADVAAAIALAGISVFAPQAIFRTRSASDTRGILENPSAPLRPWRSSTIVFDAVLVGAMIAGLYFSAAMMITLLGVALIVRLMFTRRRTLEADPNARFYGVIDAWTTAATATAAFAIIKPLAPAVTHQHSLLPLVFAGLAAMFLGLAFNAVERWVGSVKEPWAFARDAIDPRRIVVALVSATLAWVVTLVAEYTLVLDSANGATTSTLTGFGAFIAGWLILTYASIILWRRDANRTLAMWSAHQSRIVSRLADGSLSPELAARASLHTTTRMAIIVFGATRAAAVVDAGDAGIRTQFIAVDRHEHAPSTDITSLDAHPHLHMSSSNVPSRANITGVTIGAWLWPGWFLTRSRTLVQQFIDLATATMLTPVLASGDVTQDAAFDTMFDAVHHWPTVDAFRQAVDVMRARTDAAPHHESLVIGVFGIDDFGALAGGRFEQAALAQVVRFTLGNPDFVGHDVFVAYEEPGRVWVALAGGPIIRSSIELLRSLQSRINDQGAVPAAKMDLDVHVSVSFGYGAHQVDDFSLDGLMTTALERLAIDAGARSPFEIDSIVTFDITPEDIIGEPSTPVTAVDVLARLRADVDSDADAFPVRVTPIVDQATNRTRALRVAVGWRFSLGQTDFSDPAAFSLLVNRQPELAALATSASLRAVRSALAEADLAGRPELPIMVELPALLMHPDSGRYSLPNLVTAGLNRAEAVRTVILVDTVGIGAGQALRLIADRGFHIAVTAAAAAGADPTDLYGWNRWAVVLPPSFIEGPNGIDTLAIQQTVAAIAGKDTHLIGEVRSLTHLEDLDRHHVTWTLALNQEYPSVQASVEALLANPGD